MTSESGELGVVVVGGGAIGASLATVFADHGARVWLIEPDDARRGDLGADIARRHATMRDAGLAVSAPDDAAARIAVVASLQGAPTDPALVLEAGPENLAAKQAIFADLFSHLNTDAVIATTSSAMTVSQILDAPDQRARCLVAHPANPPTLIRVVELVPAPETHEAALAKASEVFAAAGFSPVALGAEVPGFVFNRLQSAVLREAYRLVREGVIDVDGLDRLVRDGLGLRWALGGPFETADLNTAGGIAAHAARLGPAYRAIGEGRGETGCEWTPDLVAEVERQRRAILPAEQLADRAAWREAALARLIAARRQIVGNDG